MVKKRIPLRTCVQCRTVRPKRELVRIVRSPEGTIGIDEKGKAPGRGAYLCRDRICWEKAISQRRLDHALKTTLNLEDQKRLVEYGQQLPHVQENDAQKGEGDSHSG